MTDHEEIIKGYDPVIARRIFSYIKPYARTAVIALLALFAAAAAELVTPVILQRTIDREILVSHTLFPPSEMQEELPGRYGVSPGQLFRIGGLVFAADRNLKDLGSVERRELADDGLIARESWYLAEMRTDSELKELLEEYPDMFQVSSDFFAVEREFLDSLTAEERRVIRQGNIERVWTMGGVYALLLTAVLIFSFAQVYLMAWIGQRVMEDLRISLFGHLLRQSLSYFTRTPVGTLVTRITNDVETIQEFFTSVAASLIKDAALMLGVLGVIFFLDVRLALWTLVSIPPVAAAAVIYRSRARDAYRRVRLWVSRVNAFLSEHISGMDVVHMFAREDRSRSMFREKSLSLLKASLGEMYVFATFRPLVNFFTSVSIGTMIYFGSGLVLETGLSLGVVIAYINLINLFYAPVMNFAEQFTVLQSAMAGGERIFSLLDTEERIPDSGSIPLPELLEGRIEFKSVRFAYKDDTPVIQDLSFTIEPGETAAIVGYTGAGKTTIANLLTRLWDIQSGEILVDGQDIRTVPLADLRRQIQSVQQDFFMFSGSVAENIRFGSDVTEEQLRQAAILVQADGFITSLPDGYDTVISEGGANISVGQRQLLSFSRVLVQNPKVIILDEATASIDTETEQLVQEGVRRLMRGRTSLVIAHRLSTIRDADKIIVLSGGRAAEIGTHDELMARRGIYWNLYKLQFGLQEAEDSLP